MSQKQYWDYTIPERVKYATGNYFTTFKDDPHIDGLTETEIESCYAAGIQWATIAVPTYRSIAAFEACQMLGIMGGVAEYKSSVIDFKTIENRDLKLFGLSVNELHRIAFCNLADDLYNQILEEYYWFMELAILKTSRKTDELQGLWYKALATNVDNYIVLRNVDGLFSWLFVFALCSSSDKVITSLPEWHDDCVEIAIWLYDAVSACKHRAEVEPCDLSRYVDGGMPPNVTNMLEYARQRFWHLNKKYHDNTTYQPYNAVMQSATSWTYFMYRYRHVIFLGPVLAENTESDDKATRDEKYIWYKVAQAGGPIGVIKEYRKSIETGNLNNIKKILNRNHDLKCKQVMRKLLEEDINKYEEIEFPVSNGNIIKI